MRRIGRATFHPTHVFLPLMAKDLRLTSDPAAENDPIGAHAGIIVRNARSTLAIFIVITFGAIYLESVSPAYLGCSVALGGLMIVNTLFAWRRRSNALSVFGLLIGLQLHFYLPKLLGIPQMPLSGALVICSVFLLVLSVARRQICRWCRLTHVV
jgi:hypothetical protein